MSEEDDRRLGAALRALATEVSRHADASAELRLLPSGSIFIRVLDRRDALLRFSRYPSLDTFGT